MQVLQTQPREQICAGIWAKQNCAGFCATTYRAAALLGKPLSNLRSPTRMRTAAMAIVGSASRIKLIDSGTSGLLTHSTARGRGRATLDSTRLTFRALMVRLRRSNFRILPMISSATLAAINLIIRAISRWDLAGATGASICLRWPFQPKKKLGQLEIASPARQARHTTACMRLVECFSIRRSLGGYRLQTDSVSKITVCLGEQSIRAVRSLICCGKAAGISAQPSSSSILGSASRSRRLSIYSVRTQSSLAIRVYGRNAIAVLILEWNSGYRRTMPKSKYTGL